MQRNPGERRNAFLLLPVKQHFLPLHRNTFCIIQRVNPGSTGFVTGLFHHHILQKDNINGALPVIALCYSVS